MYSTRTFNVLTLRDEIYCKDLCGKIRFVLLLCFFKIMAISFLNNEHMTKNIVPKNVQVNIENPIVIDC